MSCPKPELVLLLGSVRHGEYEALLAHGYRLGLLLDENRKATLPNAEDFEWSASHDFSQPLPTLAPILQSLADRYRVIAVLNLREFYVRAHAFAAQQLQLPGLKCAHVERMLHKTTMRHIFAHSLGELATPRFSEVSCLETAQDFVQKTGFPVILKPSSLYGSMFVRTVNDLDALKSELGEIQRQIASHQAKHGFGPTAEKLVQIEEYVEGSVHSIEGLIDAKGRIYLTPIVDVLTGYDIGQDHFGHVLRHAHSKLPQEAQSLLQQRAREALAALEIRQVAAHVEFIVSAQGVKLLEIAARPGGHRHRVLEMTHGIALNYQYLRMLLGGTPDLSASSTGSFFTIVTPYPARSPSSRGLKKNDAVARLRSYRQQQIKAKLGETIGPARAGFMSPWVIELQHPEAKVVEQDTSWLLSQEDFFG